MTSDTVGFGRSFPRLWILPIGILVGVFGLAVVGTLSRAVVADFLAWWPAWALLAVAAVLLRHRKFGPVRAAGVVPLVAIVGVGLFTWGHLTGWTLMPSASQRLVGPELGSTTHASLNAAIDGVVEVKGGAEFLYVIEAAEGGGQFGIPIANEESIDSMVAIDLIPRADPGLYTFAGWQVALSESPSWSLTLDGAVSADLSAVAVESLAVSGAGTVTLGAPGPQAEVNVSGSYDLVLSVVTPVHVIGVASVPATWTLTDVGAESPTESGDGWRIVVSPGANVRVLEG